MTVRAFLEMYFPFAKAAQDKTGVPALFALAQSALESGWGQKTPGNMLFGVKATGKDYGGWQGHKQLITTTEYGNDPNLKFPEILAGYPKKEGSRWKYLVKDYFRAYISPLNTFMDWAGMLSTAARYKVAMQNKQDPYRFAEEVAKGGYATDPNYAEKVKKVMDQIMHHLTVNGPSKIWVLVITVVVLIGITAVVYGMIKNQGTKKLR